MFRDEEKDLEIQSNTESSEFFMCECWNGNWVEEGWRDLRELIR